MRAKPAKRSGVLKKRCAPTLTNPQSPSPAHLVCTDTARYPPRRPPRGATLPSAPRLFQTALLSSPSPDPASDANLLPVCRGRERLPLAHWRNVDSSCICSPPPSRFWHRWRQPREARRTRVHLKKSWRQCPSLMPSENFATPPAHRMLFLRGWSAPFRGPRKALAKLGQEMSLIINSTEGDTLFRFANRSVCKSPTHRHRGQGLRVTGPAVGGKNPPGL